ncbi:MULTISPECIES: helix-turn-helix domain-containing protein [Oscillospiraceae]|uniref:helix-turn-helix domain-containing protein n=1 Tax=Oscillospiraceae TaxID=216572 RepID=UPI0009A6B25C|nr:MULTISPECIES: helix-turn-helix transcriptional regulator [Oscillospiraceae]RGB68778.1 XRE family transcriptional regulator [Harryflintia acetispora]
MDIAKRLRQLRGEKGLSINGLALRAGLSQSFVRDIELGKKKPGVESLQFLCEALGISLRDFFNEEAEPDPISHKLKQQIFRLSPEQQEKLLEFLSEIK